MRFGPRPPGEAEGCILAHSIAAGALRLKKGRVLSAADIAALEAAGVAEVTVAELAPEDVDEDAAASAIAAALAPDPDALGIAVSAPFTGRVNLFAAAPGLFRVNAAGVDALNAIDPAITLATLPDWARVGPRRMLATIKIIPYAVPDTALARARDAAHPGLLRLAPFEAGRSAAIVLTRTPGMKESLIAKGGAIVADRVRGLGLAPLEPVVVAHDRAAVRDALSAAGGDMVLVLGGSATSDPGDTCPQALVDAGGCLQRFGMPVDPGNLLFLGDLDGRPVVGLPGCARSPALNGADWVLERLAAGFEVSDADIAGMGVGGLLKEIPQRPQPRDAPPAAGPVQPKVAALVLAAGASRRMGGRDKLLEPVAGRPVLRRVADAALASAVTETLVVLPPQAPERAAALTGSGVRVVEAPDCAEGMAASLRAGLAALALETDAVAVVLADMPEIEAGHLDRLIAAFDPVEGREICRAAAADGTPGHPVLFGRRFFETLAGLTGDRGARDLLREALEFVVDVPLPGRAAVIDLDTPEDWEAWRRATGA